MSIDLKPDHILVAMFCPGWVQTDMGGEGAQITLDESMKDLVPSIYKLSNEHHGGNSQKNAFDCVPLAGEEKGSCG
ncbi:hypothetical protein ANCDUO_02848 [Ancylostoma duodenale]|uniref:C-factor domain protein n=1 Tax=Ancylostoma duodenale TaxID=51022 RepID=A0A0C2DAR4_9BILA|nr:hypothetical protein ANCDUO_02848 [Ancylostoma duodenale]